MLFVLAYKDNELSKITCLFERYFYFCNQRQQIERQEMKRLKWIGGLLMAVALAGCLNPATSVEMCRNTSLQSELASIDTLMQFRPDSALALLLDSPIDDPYYQLLLSEAFYKNDYQQTNRPKLLEAITYYDSILAFSPSPSVAFLDARCHYMNGVGYYETDSVELACIEYLKASEIMEENFGEKELVGNKAKFMALTYAHLVTVYGEKYLHEQAIYFGKCALSYHQKYYAEPWHKAWVFQKIGVHYEMIEQNDSAYLFFNKAMDALPDSNSLTYRDIATQQALLLYYTEKDGLACLNKLKLLLNKSESENERLTRSALIGDMYFKEGLYDSAWYYLYPVFCNSPSTGLKKISAEDLVEICKSNGETQELAEVTSYLASFAFQDENSSKIKSELTELYDDYWKEKNEKCFQRNIRKLWDITLCVVSGLLALIILVIVLYRKNKVVHRMQQAALSGRLKRSNEALRNSLETIKKQEREQNTTNKTDINGISSKERYDEFFNKEICLKIKALVDELNSDELRPLKTDLNVSDFKTFALSKMQQSQFLKTIRQCYPDLLDSLKTIYPALNRKEILFCGFLLLGVDRLSICVLLQESYHTCRRISLRLEKNLNCPQSLCDFLLEKAGLC